MVARDALIKLSLFRQDLPEFVERFHKVGPNAERSSERRLGLVCFALARQQATELKLNDRMVRQ